MAGQDDRHDRQAEGCDHHDRRRPAGEEDGRHEQWNGGQADPERIVDAR